MSEDFHERRGRSVSAQLTPVRRWVSVAACMAVLGGGLAACAPGDGDYAATGVYRLLNSQRNPPLEVLESTVEYARVQLGRAMMHAPQALLMLERNLDQAVEQRIFLPNDTSLRGDNVIHLRAQTSRSARLTEFSFDEITTRFGGLPAPFQRTDASGLMSGEDSLGPYVYARQNVGTTTSCVLVIRRLPPSARPLPRNTQSLDVMMRNCVIGDFEQAMAPVRSGALGTAAAPQGTVYNISPFAAPQR